MTSDNNLQRLAFQLASQHRTCPGDALLFSESGGPERDAHLLICPACQERLECRSETTSDWQETFRLLRDGFSLPAQVEPAPGQIWKLKLRLSGWGPGKRYFNPPLVLILQQQSTAGELKVTQLYSDDLLMGDDDVWLGEGIGFAQPWNIYTLNRRDLDRMLTTVETELVTECLDYSLVNPPDIQSGSNVWYFRKMEKEVGEIMALRSSDQSANELMLDWMNDAKLLGASLAERFKGWIWPDNYDDAWGLVSGARPTLSPLAADTGGLRHDINILTIGKDSAPEITRQSCGISRWVVDEHGLLVRGSLPESARRAFKLHARWILPGEQALCAEETDFDLETGVFKIRFHSLTDQQDSLMPLQLVLVTLA